MAVRWWREREFLDRLLIIVITVTALTLALLIVGTMVNSDGP